MTLDPHDNIAGLWAWPLEEKSMAPFPQYDTHIHGGSQNDDKPETSRMVDGVEHLTVSEYLRRVEPYEYPVASELISASGFDRTYIVLGKMAADEGRLLNVEPVKMYHPDYDSVNGWPVKIIERAWDKFRMRYSLDWQSRDPELPEVPEPVLMPPVEYSPQLAAQVRAAVRRRGIEIPFARDPRWRGALSVLLSERPDETPEQALVRRTSAAGAMFAIEKEYQG